MGILSVNRTKDTFKDRIASQKQGSQEGYWIAIDNFEKFSMEKFGKVNIIPDMLSATENEVFDTLQAWINWNSERAQSTISVYFSRIRKYLHYMGIKLDSQDIKNELQFKHKVEEELYGLTLEDIQKILGNLEYHTKVQFMCQLSGLTRIGEIVQLRKRNLILDKQNIIVKIPPEIAKFNKARTTFFSREASVLLRPKLRDLDDDDLVFATNEISHHAETNAEQKLRRAINRVGLNMRYTSTNRYFINTHSFRAYGITKLSRHDPNFAKKIAGQKGYMLQYDRIGDDEKLEIYHKYESNLTIDNTAIQKAEIEKLKTEKDELKVLQKDLEIMKEDSSKYKEDNVREIINAELSKMLKNQDGKLIKELDDENDKLRAKLKKAGLE